MFSNRTDAGKQLAEKLQAYKNQEVVVFSLSHGGVPIGIEVSKVLDAPLELIFTKKIKHPYNPVYAIGAISENGISIYNDSKIAKVEDEWLENEEAKLKNEIKYRRYKFGDIKHFATGKTAIIVDDGIATGFTMLAAIDDVKKQNPSKIVVAIPVVPEQMAQKLEQEVDEVVAIDRTRTYKGSVSAYYEQLEKLSDEELLERLELMQSSDKI